MISENRNVLLSIMLLAAVAVFLTLASGCKEGGQEDRKSKVVPGVITQNGETMLTLDKAAQERAGIIIAPLKAALHQEELQGYGTILQPDALIDIRNSYLSATASADKAAAALDASRREYERLKKLNEDNHNISDKVLQTAGAVLASSEADASASEEKVKAIKQTATVRWGRVISGWIFNSSPEFDRLAELKEVLLRITLQSDTFMETAPGSISIQAPGSKLVSARFVSYATSADPRTQGAGFLYAAPSSAPGLIPGMNVQVFMPFGPRAEGVVIPLSSVLWFQGKAWAYVQTGPEHFTRREVPTTKPINDGFFVKEGFGPEDIVVIKGAQILLSRELLPSQPAGGGEEEED